MFLELAEALGSQTGHELSPFSLWILSPLRKSTVLKLLSPVPATDQSSSHCWRIKPLCGWPGGSLEKKKQHIFFGNLEQRIHMDLLLYVTNMQIAFN